MQRVALLAVLLLLVAHARVAWAQVPGSDAFAAPPNFGPGGQAAAVFLGGSVAQLESAARATAANGVWVQDNGGVFQLLIVGGPAFLRDAFTSRFAGGFPSAVAVTLTRPTGASSPPNAASPAPTATPAPPTPPGGVPGPSTND